MKSEIVFDVLTDKYDAWYDSGKGLEALFYRDRMNLAWLKSLLKVMQMGLDSSVLN